MSHGRDIPARVPGLKIGLSFSAGIDSLAAYCLASRYVQLISVDFGREFARETAFFTRFNPVVCRTDFRQKCWRGKDWRFMGAAACLLAHHLGLGTIVFGSIFEASYWSYVERLARKPPQTAGPFGAAGMAHGSVVQGLTEFATTQVVNAFAPHLLEGSLASLAVSGSEKLFRKRLLIDIIRHRWGGDSPPFEFYEYPRERVEFGKSIAVDFLALYCATTYGYGVVHRWIPNMPCVKLPSLDFMFKFNPLFVNNIPQEIRETVLLRMAGAGIYPFAPSDWEGFYAVRSVLSRYYPIPR